MTADTPATRRKFAGQWDEISYLHDKLLYWMYEREDSPWYPTMRLFRQPQTNDWPAVVARIREELRQFVRS